MDTYAIEENKSMYMSLMMLSPPLGIIIGFVMTRVIMIDFSWQASFVVQGLIQSSLALIFLFVSGDYIEIDVI